MEAAEHSLPPIEDGHPPAAPSLAVLGRRLAPLTLANDRIIPVPGPLGEALPDGGLRRGSVIDLEGTPGSGCTSLVLDLVAAVTATGEWAVFLSLDPALRDVPGTPCAPAASEAGVVLDRLAVVRDVPRDRWAIVAAALVEGVSLVVADLPPRVRAADARHLTARARERGSILVVQGGSWPERPAVRLCAEGGEWRLAGGRLEARPLRVAVEGRGRPRRQLLIA